MTSAPAKPLRAGIIGTGGIAQSHARAMTTLEGEIDLVAVTDLDRDRAAAFAAEHGDPTVFLNAQELLESAELDLVSICTPPQTHAPLAITAMRAGITALVEKPTALSLAEVDEIAEVETETGVQTLTVFQHRFGAAARRLGELVDSGALGRPLVATCDTLWFRPDSYFDVPWRGRWDIEGGGPTMGHGIHQFDLLLSVLGDWQEITAVAARQLRPTDTEDVSAALVRMQSGAVVTVMNSLLSPRETSRVRFDFERATVEVEHLYGYQSSDWIFTPAPGHEELAEQWNPAEDGTSGHRHQLAAIAQALTAGERAGVDLAEARRTLEFAAATYASAFQGTPITAGQIAGDDPFMTSMSGGMVPWEQTKNQAVTS